MPGPSTLEFVDGEALNRGAGQVAPKKSKAGAALSIQGGMMRYLAVLVLAGCASTTEVVPYGGGMYLITANDGSGVTNFGQLHTQAAKEANAYCDKQGKTMRASQTSANRNPAGSTATLIFSCD